MTRAKPLQKKAQSISDADVVDHKFQYPFAGIDYIKANFNNGVTDFTFHQPSSTANRGIDDRKMEIESTSGFGNDISPYTTLYSNVQFNQSVSPFATLDIVGVKDTNLSTSFKDLGDLQSLFWWTYKGNPSYLKTEYFKLRGIDYSFGLNIAYDRDGYQILKMTKKFNDGYTEVECLRVASL